MKLSHVVAIALAIATAIAGWAVFESLPHPPATSAQTGTCWINGDPKERCAPCGHTAEPDDSCLVPTEAGMRMWVDHHQDPWAFLFHSR